MNGNYEPTYRTDGPCGEGSTSHHTGQRNGRKNQHDNGKRPPGHRSQFQGMPALDMFDDPRSLEAGLMRSVRRGGCKKLKTDGNSSPANKQLASTPNIAQCPIERLAQKRLAMKQKLKPNPVAADIDIFLNKTSRCGKLSNLEELVSMERTANLAVLEDVPVKRRVLCKYIELRGMGFDWTDVTKRYNPEWIMRVFDDLESPLRGNIVDVLTLTIMRRTTDAEQKFVNDITSRLFELLESGSLLSECVEVKTSRQSSQGHVMELKPIPIVPTSVLAEFVDSFITINKGRDDATDLPPKVEEMVDLAVKELVLRGSTDTSSMKVLSPAALYRLLFCIPSMSDECKSDIMPHLGRLFLKHRTAYTPVLWQIIVNKFAKSGILVEEMKPEPQI